MSDAQTQADFFAHPIIKMLNPRHPLVVLASRLPWDDIEEALKPSLARQTREGRLSVTTDLPGIHQVLTCRIPDDCIDSKRYPLFMARDVMRGAIQEFQSTRR